MKQERQRFVSQNSRVNDLRPYRGSATPEPLSFDIIRTMAKIFTEEENKAWQRTLPGKLCSACVALRSGDKVLMVKATYKDHWTFPSGVVDENESPKTGALRETFEEIGLTLNESDVEFLTVIYSQGKDGYLDRFNFVFITDQFDQNTELVLQPEEIETYEWVSIHEITERSKHKGSYVNIQRLLTDDIKDEKYIEVL